MKFNFVIRCSDAELDAYLKLKPEDGAKVFTRGDLNWCLQTYLMLSKYSDLELVCSNKIIPGTINLIHSDQLLELGGEPSDFIVCVRADYPARRWAHFHIVQNKNQLGPDSAFLPHWVQPGLIKRNSNRSGVKSAAYSGQVFNGNLAADESEWQRLLGPHGINFFTLTEGKWHDLSEVDVLIAVRSFDKKPHNTKPPTKLFSAWHAEIPFIGGYDSAFQQVGVPGTDYLLAENPDEVVSNVLRLSRDPELYAQLVKNGVEKAKLYTEETIAKTWENVLKDSVLQRYYRWKKNISFEKARFKVLREMGMREHQLKQVVKSIVK